jgi:hypothetical protein
VSTYSNGGISYHLAKDMPAWEINIILSELKKMMKEESDYIKAEAAKSRGRLR